jgi:ClpP class serine protease
VRKEVTDNLLGIPTLRTNTEGAAMSWMGIFWIILILLVLQPLVRRQWLAASRQRMIRRIEQERRTRVIALIHRQETLSLLGFPLMRYVDMNDAEEVIRAVEAVEPERPIDLLLHTPGGLMVAALQIARAIRDHPGRVTAFVPHYAMSGGTLIALAADEIVMGPHAALGPVDPVIGRFPAASLMQVTSRKPIERIDDETLVLADQGRKAIAQIRRAVRELLAEKVPIGRADELARLLSEGHWTHDYPLTIGDLQEWGLPASTAMPRSILELMALYPQPLRRPSVTYRPEHDGRRDHGNAP